MLSVGKSSKYMYRWLEESEWNTFLKTYPSGVVKDIWEAVFIMCDLFNDIANEVMLDKFIQYTCRRLDDKL